MKKTKIIIIALIICLTFVTPALGYIFGPNHYRILNDNVWFSTDTAFSLREIRQSVGVTPAYIIFNDVELQVTSNEHINITLLEVIEYTSTARYQDTIIKFKVNSPAGNTVVFKIGGLSVDSVYSVKVDSNDALGKASNSYGYITFQQTSWSNHTFTVTEGKDKVQNSIYVTEDDMIKGGFFGAKMFYISGIEIDENTTINLVDRYNDSSWVFFHDEYSVDSILIYGISKELEFIQTSYDGDRTVFMIETDDYSNWYGYVVVPNPGYFDNSDWWFNLLNDIEQMFIDGENLS